MDNQQQNSNLLYYGSVIDPKLASTIIDKYKNGISLMQLSQEYGYNIATIRYFLIRNNVTIRNVKQSMAKFIKSKEIKYDNFLVENIIGWLLGDGGCRLHKHAVNPFFNYTDKHLDHILYVQNILTTYNIYSSISHNKHTDCYCLQTEILPFFKQFYELFYGYEGLNENGQKRKILPNITITPIILRNWYIGDGCSSKESKSYNHRGLIVDKYYNDYILQQLNNICGHVAVYKHGNCYCYHFSNKALIKLLNYIGECPVESYKYKWITRCSTTIIEASEKSDDGIV